VAELQAVDEAAAQSAERAALEAALTASAAPANDSAASLAIDLAVSLLAANPAGRPFEPPAPIVIDQTAAVSVLPPPPAAPFQELPALADEAAPGELPPATS